MTQGHFEAKKHAYRQTQDGVVISFVMHPSDVSAAIATAPLGTRYIVGFAEIGDDDRPVAEPVDAEDLKSSSDRSAGSNPAGSTKIRRPFASLPFPQQAALCCQDNDFQWFLSDTTKHPARLDWTAADEVRDRCGVESRSHIEKNTPAGDRWEALEREFQAWVTTKRYADAQR